MFMLLCSYYVVMMWCSHYRHKTFNMRYFLVCVTFPLCRYVASVNQALCLCASENSMRQICGFVLLLMLMLVSRMFSLAYTYVMLKLMLMR